MLDQALTNVPTDRPDAIALPDRVQMALAIADQPLLQSLLTHCTPPLSQPHRVGAVRAHISVPVEARRTVDAVLQFEVVNCVLADSPEEIEAEMAATVPPHLLNREYLLLTRCESETHTLGQHLSLAEAIAILETSGFSPEQVNAIIHLPKNACHRSWWYAPDEQGEFCIPFLRIIRTVYYTDGTLDLQYKDYFAQDKPVGFTSQEVQVLVEIQSPQRTFRKTLDRINLARSQLGIDQALLIGDDLSELEARAFISQGISLYTAHELMLSTHSDCRLCANDTCPLQGREDTGVTTCRRFCLDPTVE